MDRVVSKEKIDLGGYLGPALVIEVGPHDVKVELEGGASASAQMALAFPYQPAVGDVLLVAGKADRHYVIGVLHGTGTTELNLPGDVRLRAAGGALHLAGDAGVTIEGAEVDVRAGKLRVVADAAHQTFSSLYQRVTDLFSSRAGERHEVTEGSSYTQAKRAAIVGEETVTLNGKAIHLG